MPYSQSASAIFQTAIPLTGATVAFAESGLDQDLYINPAGTLATLTANLPSDAVSRLGQLCIMSFRRVITTLVVGATSGGATILNAPVAASIGTMFIFKKVDVNTWACMQ